MSKTLISSCTTSVFVLRRGKQSTGTASVSPLTLYFRGDFFLLAPLQPGLFGRKRGELDSPKLGGYLPHPLLLPSLKTHGNGCALIYLCPSFVEEDLNMNTELLDDTLDEIFEETDSKDYNENESEMEELETEVSEDTERWADDGDLKNSF
ncbi:hypothetical protein AVEN_133233-1 [Araneus ventricosus]|uniref:Uncharacterized protein n=1 Tax=Araneus ventricosus TaxID=182803 RepID=A0A4Y2J3V2_ARAVE|nr:hypothetical protein AVEN_133233-1 [Araneus ventricosus]